MIDDMNKDAPLATTLIPGRRVTLIRVVPLGPALGSKGTVRKSPGPDGLVTVHFDGHPDHRAYGVSVDDIRTEDMPVTETVTSGDQPATAHDAEAEISEPGNDGAIS